MTEKKLTCDELQKKLAAAEALIDRLQNVDIKKLTAERDAARDERDAAKYERDRSYFISDNALLDSRKMEAAYVESEQNFRNSIEACPLGIRIITRDAEPIYINKAFVDICGYKSIEEMQAVPRKQFYTPASYAAYLKRREKRKKGEYVPPEYEIDIRRPDGSVRNLQVYQQEIIWGGEKQFMVMYQDITEQKQAQKELQESEEKYHSLVEHSKDGIIFIENGKISYFNTRMLEIVNYPAEEVAGKSIFSFIAPEHQEIAAEYYRKRVAGEEAPPTYELSLLNKEGQRVFVEVSASMFNYKGKKADLAVVRDITARKKTEAALLESEFKYHSIIENSKDAILLTSPDGGILSANPAAVMMFGRTEDEICRLGRNALLDLSDPRLETALKQREATGEFSGELTFVRADGSRFPGDISTKIFYDKDGHAKTSMIIHDISEREKTEEALKESEKSYRLLADYYKQLNNISLTFNEAVDTADLFEKMAESFRSLTGALAASFSAYDKEARVLKVMALSIDPISRDSVLSMLGTDLFKMRMPVSTDDIEQMLTQSIRRPKDLHELSLGVIPKDISDSVMDAIECQQIVALAISYAGEIMGTCVAYLRGDQTVVPDEALKTYISLSGLAIKRKQAEEALVFERDFTQSLFDTAQAILLVVEPDGRISTFNPYMEEISGYKLEEVKGKHWFDVFIPERNRPHIRRLFSQAIDDVQTRGVINSIVTKDGREKQIEWYDKTLKDASGKVVGLLAVGQDVTERKHMEEKLIDEATRRRILIEQSRDGIVILDQDGAVFEANRRFAEMLGCTMEEVLKLKVWDWEFQYPPEQVTEMIRTVDEAGDHFETRHRRKDGSIYDVEISTNGAMFAGQKLIFCVCRDITERKQAEIAIQQSEERFHRIFQEGPLGIVLSSLDYKFNIVNDRFCQMFGYTEDEFKSMTFKDITLPEEITEDFPMLQKLVNGELAYYSREKRYLKKDKTMLWGSLTVTLLRDNSDKPLGFLVMVEDITNRKQAEEALKTREEFLDNIIENTPNALWVSDEKGTVIRMNHALRDLLKITDAEIIGKYNVLHDTQLIEQGCLPLVKSVFAEGKTVTFTLDYYTARENQVKLSRQTHKILDIVISPVKDKTGKVINTICLQKDITARVQAEQALKESEDKFKYIFDNSAIGKSLTFVSGELHVNKAFCDMLGYTARELSGKTWQEITHPDDIEASQKNIDSLLARRKKRIRFVKRYLHKNGSIIWADVLTSLRYDKDNRPLYFITSVMDITERKKLVDQLAMEREEIKLIIESSPVLIFYKDKNGKFLRVNKSLAEVFNLSEDELLGKTVFDLFTHEIAQSMTDNENEIFKSGKPKLNVIEQYKTPAGIRWAQADKIPIFDENGKAVAIIGFAQDITERLKLEESLRYHASLVDSVSDAIISSNMDFRLMSWNKAAENIYGWREEEVLGKKTMEVLQPVYPYTTAADIETSLQQHGYWNGEVIHKRKGGGEIYVLASASTIDDGKGGIRGVVSVFTDITERKRSEEKIKHLNLTLRSIRDINQLITKEKERDKLIQGICDSLVESRSFRNAWIVLLDDSHMPVTWASANTSNFSALIKEFQSGKLPLCVQKAMKQQDIMVTVNPSATCPECPALEGKGDIGSMTIRLEIEGNIYGVLCASMERSLLTDPDEISLFKEVSMDISFALRDIELSVKNELLEQEQIRSAKLESIGTLAGGIAHDFNNLLTGIMGNIGLARTSVQPPHPIIEILDEAEKAAVRARDLTQQLLTFARGGKPVKKLLNIAAVFKESAEFALRGSDVKLELSFPDDLWSVEADEGQIGQVINNLVINADEAMPSGGILKIDAVNLVVSRATGLPLPAGNYVRINIKDNGTGIPREYLKRIFEPYFTTKQKGSGLGLATAYSVIKNHGGYIEAESVQHQGSTFRIYLPTSKKKGKGGRKVKTKNAGQAGGKVLVMDDEEIIRKMLKNMLSLAGYEVELSADGAEAIEKYSRAMQHHDPFDAVIMDLTIPGGMGGKEAVKKLLEIDPHASVIVSSGYATDPIMSEYKKYGFKAVIAKPYSVKQLQESLSNLPRRKI